LGISVDLLDVRTVPRGRRVPGREAFKLKAMRDFAACIGRARDFDESLHLALMIIQGTYSIRKGALFLDQEGEFRMVVSRGVPPGVPPVAKTREFEARLRRSTRPILLNRRGVSEAIRRTVAAVERSVPSFAVNMLCPLGTRNGSHGFLLLGPAITGVELTVRQRETLGVMVSFLSSHISNRRALFEVSHLNDVLRLQIRENERLITGMEEIYLDTIRALAMAVEAKDPYTRGHSERVAKISVAVAKGLRLPDNEVHAVRIASILHDVGKIGTSRAILSKPTALTEEEREEIRRHPVISYDILSEIRFPYPNVALLARDHHEWLDGTGYPGGKREPQILVGSRIIALADAFDAMVSSRPYRNGLPLLHALGEIRSYVYRHYDPEVARTFFRSVRREIAAEGPDRSVFAGPEEGYSPGEAIEYLDRVLREL
jgi:HD-GYP domain-containing protein (c-di-GMP phosphodiesterase class II)